MVVLLLPCFCPLAACMCIVAYLCVQFDVLQVSLFAHLVNIVNSVCALTCLLDWFTCMVDNEFSQ